MPELVKTLTYGEVQVWLDEVEARRPEGRELVALPLPHYYGIAVQAAAVAGWLGDVTEADVLALPTREVITLGRQVWERYREETAVDPN